MNPSIGSVQRFREPPFVSGTKQERDDQLGEPSLGLAEVS